MNKNYSTSDSFELDNVDELLDKIGAQLGAIEDVTALGERYAGIVLAKVISAEKHPNADKLKVCWIDDGAAVKGVPRNGHGHVQVVCGAPNVAAGQLVVWLPPGSTVPSTFEKDPFVLEAREIRGVLSNGMIGSAKELSLGDDHNGILVLDGQFIPGTPLVQALDLDDYIVDIENKMFTHRPDCFGLLGVARELAGIYNKPFKSPGWYNENADLPADGRKNVHKLEVRNNIPRFVPRFCAVAIKDVKVATSPVWLQSYLARSGIRPVNNIVDVTNWFMLATAQPLHAYDYDKVKSGVLGVRLSKKGEKLALLNGKTIELNDGAVVITDGQKPIGLGGVMGGADTEVDNNTKSIILECATFDMNQTRRTAMEYGIFTDAATRFTKNQSPRQNRAVIVKAAGDLMQLFGGRQASPLIDDKNFEAKDNIVGLDIEFINSRLGLDLGATPVKKILENVEFKVETTGQSLKVTVPFWRTDIEIPEDIVEEVGRLYGYDKLPVALPERDLAPAERNKMIDFKDGLRDILRRAGANEVLTYSFVHESLLKKIGQAPADAYQIKNAISPDLQYYRLSLTPSLLDKIHPNIRAGFDGCALFEIGKGHNQKMKNEEGLPQEFEMLSLVLSSKSKNSRVDGAPFYAAKELLTNLAYELGVQIEYRPIKEEESYPVAKPFDHERSAQVWAEGLGLPLGMVGEYKHSVIRSLKLPGYTAGFEIGIEQLLQAAPAQKTYKPLNRYPEVEQDFNLRSRADLSYAKLTGFLKNNLDKLSKDTGYEFSLRPLDIYQKENDKDYKQTTWRIILWHPERTLTIQETNKLLDELADRAKKELKAERI